MPARVPQDLDRNIALDLVRVTEAAAMAAGRWIGRGDKEGGDGAAVDAMRKLINSIQMRGVVVLVGNCLYESRDLGIFIEGCPPHAIQLAAFRYAMGRPVGDHERTQFARLLHRYADDSAAFRARTRP